MHNFIGIQQVKDTFQKSFLLSAIPHIFKICLILQMSSLTNSKKNPSAWHIVPLYIDVSDMKWMYYGLHVCFHNWVFQSLLSVLRRQNYN